MMHTSPTPLALLTPPPAIWPNDVSTLSEADPARTCLVHEGSVTFARATRSDIPAIEAMFRRCSVQSRLLRFFRPVPGAPRGYLEEVLADGSAHHAFAVLYNGETIGLAELHLTDQCSGSLALIIEDRFQGAGIGRLAFRLLLRRARELELQTLTADVLSENPAVLGALRRLEPTAIGRTDNVFHWTLALELENPKATLGEARVITKSSGSADPSASLHPCPGAVPTTGSSLVQSGPRPTPGTGSGTS